MAGVPLQRSIAPPAYSKEPTTVNAHGLTLSATDVRMSGLKAHMPFDLVRSKIMTVYVAEIKGRGIAAFHANNGSDAERLVRDRVFRDDLMAFATGGLPLWDGVTRIAVRLARPDEEVKWRASRRKPIPQGKNEGNRGGWIAFP